MATLHATVHEASDRRRLIYAKGAAEVMLGRCSSMISENGEEVPLDHELVHAQVEQLAAEGLRVLAFARGQGREGDDDISHDEVAELTFLGLQAMIDPPRQEAIDAVAASKRAGVTVKMITGTTPSRRRRSLARWDCSRARSWTTRAVRPL
jgi:cation-transporting P-type ATPase F